MIRINFRCYKGMLYFFCFFLSSQLNQNWISITITYLSFSIPLLTNLMKFNAMNALFQLHLLPSRWITCFILGFFHSSFLRSTTNPRWYFLNKVKSHLPQIRHLPEGEKKRKMRGRWKKKKRGGTKTSTIHMTAISILRILYQMNWYYAFILETERLKYKTTINSRHDRWIPIKSDSSHRDVLFQPIFKKA